MAIWGADDHTTEVLLKLFSLEDKKILCFIDKNPNLQGKNHYEPACFAAGRPYGVGD